MGKIGLFGPIFPGPAIDWALTKEGAPIAFVDTPEPRVINPTWSAFQVIKHRPHPNTTQVPINWLMTQEGSSIVGEIAQLPTTRADVSTPGINPVVPPRPDDILATEKYQAQVPELIRMASEDFAVLFK